MPCNLAVTITKATVTPQHLVTLLTVPTVEPVVHAYLMARFPNESISTSTRGDLEMWVDDYIIRIAAGKVNVTAPNVATATQLADELTQLLALLADELFARQLTTLLTPFGVTTQQVTVDNEGTSQSAYQFTLHL